MVLKVNPDIIHANSFYAGAASALAALITRKKLVLHNRDLAHFGFFSRLCGWSCKRIIAVSKAVKHAMVVEGLNRNKIEVVYNGIDASSFLLYLSFHLVSTHL